MGWETFGRFLSYLYASEESKGAPLTSRGLSEALEHAERLQKALNKQLPLFERGTLLRILQEHAMVRRPNRGVGGVGNFRTILELFVCL